MDNNIAYLSLGSNMGERETYLKEAIDILGQHPGIKVTKQSSIYETDPVGFTEQGKFLNMVIEIETSLTSEKLLKQCLQIEIDLGRERKIKWGPRIIDLDILLFNQENIKSENLLIPHPRMEERAFVLIPLLEIARDIKHPTSLVPFLEVLNQISDKGVRLWKQTNGEDAFVRSEN